jgi:hypothetical protein
LKDYDFINFWKKFVKRGSSIIKRFKECDFIIRLIVSSLKENQNDNTFTNSGANSGANCLTTKNDIKKYIQKLKRSLYLTACLFNIEIDEEKNEVTNDLDQNEILDKCLKKVILMALTLF